MEKEIEACALEESVILSFNRDAYKDLKKILDNPLEIKKQL